jgi:hypothetical protein
MEAFAAQRRLCRIEVLQEDQRRSCIWAEAAISEADASSFAIFRGRSLQGNDHFNSFRLPVRIGSGRPLRAAKGSEPWKDERPAWRSKVRLIVEPGPSRTDFLGRSITMVANEMQEYAASSREHYRETNSGSQAGDPDKAIA